MFMKSVKLEWCRGEVDNALRLLDEAVKHYPDFPKVVFVSVCVFLCQCGEVVVNEFVWCVCVCVCVLCVYV